jgi:hypothetical protein
VRAGRRARPRISTDPTPPIGPLRQMLEHRSPGGQAPGTVSASGRVKATQYPWRRNDVGNPSPITHSRSKRAGDPHGGVRPATMGSGATPGRQPQRRRTSTLPAPARGPCGSARPSRRRRPTARCGGCRQVLGRATSYSCHHATASAVRNDERAIVPVRVRARLVCWPLYQAIPSQRGHRGANPAAVRKADSLTGRTRRRPVRSL